jgi:hypothetical protein
MKSWNNKEYEDQLFYFNTKARPAVYPHGVEGSGLDHCYDCTSEVAILKQWVAKNQPDLEEAQINERVAAESHRISRCLDAQRTLSSGNCDPSARLAGIVHRQSIEGHPAHRVHTAARGFAVSEAVCAPRRQRSNAAPSQPPAKVQRTSDSPQGRGHGADSDVSTKSHNMARLFEAPYGGNSHRAGSPPAPCDVSPQCPQLPCTSSQASRSDHHEQGSTDALKQRVNDDDGAACGERGYLSQSTARFDVAKYSRMLGLSSDSALSSNYSITSGSAQTATRGLGFSAAVGASAATLERGSSSREKPVKAINAHLFPEISSFVRWHRLYSYSRIMQGPNRFLDLSLRPLSDICDAVAYCKPSVYIHGKINSLAVNGTSFSCSAQEQNELTQRFPSVLFKGFALEFSGQDGTSELSNLCSSSSRIGQIDAVDIGLVPADMLTSEESVAAALEPFCSVCAPHCILLGRTNVAIHDFIRFVPFRR